MSNVISRGNIPKALWPGIEQWFGVTYNRVPLYLHDPDSRHLSLSVGVTMGHYNAELFYHILDKHQ